MENQPSSPLRDDELVWVTEDMGVILRSVGARTYTEAMSETPHHAMEQAPVKALDPNGTVVIALGTAGFGIAALVLALNLTALRAEGTLWWLWVALTGLAMGLVGLADVARRRRRRPIA